MRATTSMFHVGWSREKRMPRQFSRAAAGPPAGHSRAPYQADAAFNDASFPIRDFLSGNNFVKNKRNFPLPEIMLKAELLVQAELYLCWCVVEVQTQCAGKATDQNPAESKTALGLQFKLTLPNCPRFHNRNLSTSTKVDFPWCGSVKCFFVKNIYYLTNNIRFMRQHFSVLIIA